MSESEDLDRSAQPSASCGTGGERGGQSGARAQKRVADPRRDVPVLQPILVVMERDTRMMRSMLVGEKGAVDEHVIKRIITFIKELG